ncbi:MAG: hypothetical protein WAM72_29050 [Xanthobacteraceae bacterium]
MTLRKSCLISFTVNRGSQQLNNLMIIECQHLAALLRFASKIDHAKASAGPSFSHDFGGPNPLRLLASLPAPWGFSPSPNALSDRTGMASLAVSIRSLRSRARRRA